MKTILDGRMHAFVDYASALFFAAAPILLRTQPAGTRICFALAAFELCLALVTKYPGGILKKVPFAFHAMVEFYTAFALVAYGIFFQRGTDRVFFTIAGVCVFLIFLLTDYSEQSSNRGRAQHRERADAFSMRAK